MEFLDLFINEKLDGYKSRKIGFSENGILAKVTGPPRVKSNQIDREACNILTAASHENGNLMC